MTADVFGFIVIALSIVLYFATRKTQPKLAQACLFCAGIGVGLEIGAVWVVSQVQAMILR